MKAFDFFLLAATPLLQLLHTARSEKPRDHLLNLRATDEAQEDKTLQAARGLSPHRRDYYITLSVG